MEPVGNPQGICSQPCQLPHEKHFIAVMEHVKVVLVRVLPGALHLAKVSYNKVHHRAKSSLTSERAW